MSASAANRICYSTPDANKIIDNALGIASAQAIIFGNPFDRRKESQFLCPSVSALASDGACVVDAGAVRDHYYAAAQSHHCRASLAIEAYVSPLTGTAAFDMGEKYYWGRGVSRDYDAALAWYRKAGRYTEALIAIGFMYQDGTGVPKDGAESMRYFRSAMAIDGYSGSCALASDYAEGRGVAVNSAEAVRLFRIGAEHDRRNCVYGLGVMYQSGEGVPRDIGRAIDYYRRAIALARAANDDNLLRMASENLAIAQGRPNRPYEPPKTCHLSQINVDRVTTVCN
jgi:TPR repeat protein